MAAWLNNVKFTPTAGSTTDWTFSSAVAGYQSPALGGAVNGRVYEYFAISADLSQWELSQGAYNTGTGVAARTTVLANSSGTGTATGQSGAGTKISFSTIPSVAVVAIKEDLISIEEANSFTAAQKLQARTNIAAAATLIATLTASGSASLLDTTSITSAYDLYMIEFVQIVPATNNAFFGMQISEDAGATYKSTTYVSFAGGWGGGTLATGFTSDTAADRVLLSGINTNLDGINSASSYGLNGVVFWHGPNSGNRKVIEGHISYWSGNGTRQDVINISGFYDGGNAVQNAVKFLMNSGNIASGKVHIYGIATS